MQILMHCAHQLQPDHQLLAANILLQLDILVIVNSEKYKSTVHEFQSFPRGRGPKAQINHETLSMEQKH